MPGQVIRSPIDGEVVREAFPYKPPSPYRGVVIRGTGGWEGYEIKMFYVQGFFCGSVTAGSFVGWAQDLTPRYPGITNHVHLEVRLHGRVISPWEIYNMCF